MGEGGDGEGELCEEGVCCFFVFIMRVGKEYVSVRFFLIGLFYGKGGSVEMVDDVG